jgi:SNF2 family DNA or RNA helicase
MIGGEMGFLKASERPGWLEYSSTDSSDCQRFLSSIQVHLPRVLHEWDRFRDSILQVSTNDLEFALSRGWIPPKEVDIDSELSAILLEKMNERENLFQDTVSIESQLIEQCLSDTNTMRTPTPFQLENLRKMLRFKSAASFSVPGAGKTSEAICYWLYHRSDSERLLIVLPQVATIAWKEEFNAWLGWGIDEICVLDRPTDFLTEHLAFNSNKRVFLVNYQKMQIAEEVIARFMLNHSQDGWSLILDESHYVKNYQGSRSQSVRRLGSLANGVRMILTGTPAPQGIEDLQAQAEFLHGVRISSDDATKLINSIFVRTTKDQLGLLPTNVELHIKKHKPQHAAFYEELLDNTRTAIHSLNESRTSTSFQRQIRPHMMHLRRAATDPSQLDRAVAGEELPWKFDFILSAVEQAKRERRKIIVWSSFTLTLLKLEELLLEYNPSLVYGGIPSDKYQRKSRRPQEGTREWMFEEFKNNPSVTVLLANPAACGESISLHHWCNEAIYVDRSYNAAHFLQSKDRIHRYGNHPKTGVATCTKTPVNYHLLITQDTIDESIDKRLSDKIDTQEEILSSGQFHEALEEPGSDTVCEVNGVQETGTSIADIEDFLNSL